MKKHLLYAGCLIFLFACSEPDINFDMAFSNIVMSTCSSRELLVGTTNCDCVVDIVTRGLPQKYRVKFARLMYNGTLASTDVMHSFNNIVDRAMIRCSSVPSSYYDDIDNDDKTEDELQFDSEIDEEAESETASETGI